MSATPRFLHVANGSSTTQTIEAAGIPGLRAVWADPLHAGPVPADLPDAALVDVRARYLAGDTNDVDAVRQELLGWRAAIADAASYDELVLWFEHDLFDQLNLVQVLDWMRERLAASPRVSLICIDRFPGRPRFKGLGELTPAELATLLDVRQPVGAPQFELAARAWRAFRDPDPRMLAELIAGDTSALPFLAAAFTRHLEEFPSTRDGLSRSERRVLELADEPVDLWSAFSRMHDDESAFYIADLSFWEVVQDLAGASPALVSVDAPPAARGALPHGTLSLTDTGRAVLQGGFDRVRRCGLDRWLGGVHLQGSGPLWRWDAERQSIVHA
jgi:hypothetical protein